VLFSGTDFARAHVILLRAPATETYAMIPVRPWMSRERFDELISLQPKLKDN